MKLEWPRWFKLTRLEWSCVILLIAMLSGLLWASSTRHPHPGIRAMSSGKASVIGQALYDYAKDHGGKYPEGKTSTEVFQTLLDQHYLWNPRTLYVNFPGKTPAIGNQLKSENVAWDFTSGIDASSSDGVPVFFLTGYHFVYKPGARAVPDKAMSFPWNLMTRNPLEIGGFMIVYYQKADFGILDADQDGSIPSFIPADFDPKDKVYRQLTP